MTQCLSLSDKYGVQCTAGRHHVSYMLHVWQGYLQESDDVRTTVMWSEEESRTHMNIEREFFALAQDMTTDKKYAVAEYQTMIADLLIRLATKEKKR